MAWPAPFARDCARLCVDRTISHWKAAEAGVDTIRDHGPARFTVAEVRDGETSRTRAGDRYGSGAPHTAVTSPPSRHSLNARRDDRRQAAIAEARIVRLDPARLVAERPREQVLPDRRDRPETVGILHRVEPEAV
ncbi:hypothetical protein [Burkholderia cepacia]|uniref:hypothetical protein n=1 Tax=Burkholderia cepacia TaxID=292 RepID=UPI001CF3249C|nr:hypothetical protein [Burkholderia cepacia]MCA8055795.1 hypothetical protein [Burkholderia cepacia]MCA8133012.1 hypothetical protein [Burkholderia cepacia]MDN7634678.1 hypothetical protein [Burkholderia cepacia]